LIRYLVKISVRKLEGIRKRHPNAGGLVVAASVEHALLIADILAEESDETPYIATYSQIKLKRDSLNTQKRVR